MISEGSCDTEDWSVFFIFPYSIIILLYDQMVSVRNFKNITNLN